MALKNLIRVVAVLFLAGAAGNLAAQEPGYIITDFDFEGTFGMDVFNVDGLVGYNLLPNQQAAPPPGFSGGCGLDGTFPPTGGSNLAPLNPSVSRDGSTIVFTRSRGFGIWKMNGDGSGAQEVVPSFPGNGHPAISPDGTKIAFIQLTGDYNQLFTVNIDGSGPTQMTFLPQDHVNSVAWSPDSTQLVFEDTSCGFFYSLKTINADGTGERFLGCKAATQSSAIDWSPDGTRIAVVNTVDGGPGISQFAPDGTGLGSLGAAQLGELNTAEAGAFRYSPDSRRLAYSNQTGCSFAGCTFKGISFINVDGTGRQDTINTTTPNHFWWQPGPAKLQPATLTLAPDLLVGGPGFRQQLSPVLKDNAGNILSRGAFGYCTGDGRFASANHLGQVRFAGSSPIQMVVTNGGLVSNVIMALPQIMDPPVSINPKTWDFGNQGIATASATQVFTLTNTGTAALNISDITVTGMNASDFVLDPVSSTCPIAGGTVNVGESCGINVFFMPGEGGSRSAQVTVNDDAAGSPHTIAFTGSGTP